MKYLEYPELEVLSRALTFELSECKVFTRLEAYSCKAVNKEKRLFKTLESSYLLSASSSPPGYLDEALASPFGRLDQPSARKTLFLLIATLNGAFPDHDFSDVNPSDFIRESSPTMVLNSLTSTLQSLKSGVSSPNSLGSFSNSLEDSVLLARSPIANEARPNTAHASSASSTGSSRSANASLSAVLDDIINIADCEVYSFHPDMDSDPHASAEPDEEGGEMEEGDPYDEGYSVDAGGVVSRGGTPAEGDVEMTDAPMFDEDIIEGGFAPRPASHEDAAHPTSTPSLSSTQSHDDGTLDEDDLGGAGAGLLWSTFSFFYNRRMKRILFVSVWSRKNTPATPATWSSPSLAATRPTAPVWALDLGASAAQLPNTSALPHERLGEHLLTPTASPAKHAPRLRPHPGARRAIDVGPYPASPQIRRHRRTARGRSASNSPAPSALSPFPHAQQVPAPGPRPVHAQPGPYSSLDAAVHSVSAPTIGRPPPPLAASPPVVKRSGTRAPGTAGTTKRTRV
ncbi:hypothetical protein MOBT1_000996 [Malassezia obtusa]|uniref:Maf1 regulator n=1 Tax=Malassezia obtusa TaxID=76774 RepID=A0AAF0ISM5_9BASI|nr:hypothetical protein MOBT1_000996 [Malassezia obtusa]